MILNKMNYKVKGLMPLFFLLAFLGCKKESNDIGLGLLGDGISKGESDTAFFANKVRTVESDSLPTSRLPSNILGVVLDPVFGRSKASLVVQPLLSEIGLELKENTIDSIRFNLKYDVSAPLTFGDINSEVAIDIYKLGQSVSIDSIYSNRFKPQLGDKIGEVIGKFDLSSKQIVMGDDTTTLAPQLSVLLDNSFGQELLDSSDSKFTANDNFLTFLKGIVLVPRDNPISGEGAIVAVEAYSTVSGLELHYHTTDDTSSLIIPMGLSSVRINAYETDLSPEIVTQQTVDGTYSKGYLQSLGGTKVKIDLDDLSQFIERGEQIVINEASIVFEADESVVDEEKYQLPPSLILSIPGIDDDGQPTENSTGFIDFGVSYYGGLEEDGSYTFRFNRYLQQLITQYNETGENDFHGFYLSVPTASPIRPDRAVINTDVDNKEVKVYISYTKLN